MKDLLSGRFISSDFALLLLRASSGGLMLFGHGISKLGRFDDEPIRFGDPLGLGILPSLILATFAEVICAALVIIGWKTRYAAIPLIILTLVIIFVVHIDDPFGKKELPLMYFFAYLGIFLAGPGKYSIDSQVRKAA